MADQTTIVDFIDAIDSPPGRFGNAGPSSLLPSIVRFRNIEPAYLNPEDPSARVNRSMLATLQSIGSPAYVNITEHRTVTRTIPPLVARVLGVSPNPAGDYHVRLDASAARLSAGSATPDERARLQQLLDVSRDTFLLVSVDPEDQVIIDVRPLLEGMLAPDVLRRTPESPSEINERVSPLSRREAADFFDIIAGMSCPLPAAGGECIPFLYPDNHCWAVANRICREAESHGIEAAKIWKFDDLRISTRNRRNCFQTWDFHVAAFVRLRQPGVPQLLVLDPVVFFEKGPMVLRDWEDALGNPAARTDLTDRSSYRQSEPGDDILEHPGDTERDLELMRAKLRYRAHGLTHPPPYADCLRGDDGVAPMTNVSVRPASAES